MTAFLSALLEAKNETGTVAIADVFVRFCQSDRRLQTSLSETRRQGGKSMNVHVAGLGSVRIAPDRW